LGRSRSGTANGRRQERFHHSVHLSIGRKAGGPTREGGKEERKIKIKKKRKRKGKGLIRRQVAAAGTLSPEPYELRLLSRPAWFIKRFNKKVEEGEKKGEKKKRKKKRAE